MLLEKHQYFISPKFLVKYFSSAKIFLNSNSEFETGTSLSQFSFCFEKREGGRGEKNDLLSIPEGGAHVGVDDRRAARYQILVSGSPPSDPQVQYPGYELPVLSVVQCPADPHLDCVRGEDAQNPGELQREQVHRFHHVHHLHHLARLRANLLRHWKRPRDADHDSLRGDQPERVRHPGLPVLAQGLHYRLPAGQKYTRQGLHGQHIQEAVQQRRRIVPNKM